METDIFLELHIPDFEKAIAFYSKMGFKVVWKSEDYLVLRKGKSVLNFYSGNENPYFKKWPKRTKRGYAVEIIIPIDDVKNFYKKVKRSAKVIEPLNFEKWARWDFRIEDPFGFYIRFTERYDWVNKIDKKQKALIKKYQNKIREGKIK